MKLDRIYSFEFIFYIKYLQYIDKNGPTVLTVLAVRDTVSGHQEYKGDKGLWLFAKL